MLDLAIVLPLALGLFGACVGSFLNVVIYRLPREELSIARPARSFCPNCKRQIPWSENLPILGWVLLGGKCRGCKGDIAFRYVLIETLTALLFAYCGHWFLERAPGGGEAWWILFTLLLLSAICIVVTWIDLDWRIIPDEITLPGLAVGTVLSLLAPSLHEPSFVYRQLAALGWERHLAALGSALAGLLAGGGALWGVGLAGRAVFKPKEGGEATDAMGFGDVKFMAAVGTLLGADGVLLVFFVGCVSGSFGGVGNWMLGLPEVLRDVGRHARRHGKGAGYTIRAAMKIGWRRRRFIPFGPFLSVGVLVVAFWRADLQHFLLHDWPRLVQGLFRPTE